MLIPALITSSIKTTSLRFGEPVTGLSNLSFLRTIIELVLAQAPIN